MRRKAFVSILYAFLYLWASGDVVAQSKIAFSTQRGAAKDIFIMNEDGSNQINLTNHYLVHGRTPLWSPDYSKILYTHAEDELFRISVMNADGSNSTSITDHVYNIHPSWSPDGSKIVFMSQRSASYEIYVVNADGSNLTNLTNSPENDDYPTWSPDGTKIVFSSNRDGNREIYVMNPDGSEQTNISNYSMGDSGSKWSPDGTKIAFLSYRDSAANIYIMNADGSNQTKFTDDTLLENDITWSPNGMYIAFRSYKYSDSSSEINNEVYVMNADGSNIVQLTNDSGDDSGLTWSSDSTKIAFQSSRDGNYEIYVMNVDGSNQTNVTNSPENDYNPSWSHTVEEIILSSPNGGEVLEAGTSLPITWHHNNLSNITINFSSDGGASWDIIAENFDANLGLYEWTVPHISSSECMINIINNADTNISDMSDNKFTIAQSPLMLLSPSGGEVFVAGHEEIITWSDHNSKLNSIKLQLSSDAGQTWEVIATGYPIYAGKYTWEIPEINSSECLIKISDSFDALVPYVTENTFTIVTLSPLNMIFIPDGSFKMGIYSNYGKAEEQPQHEVQLADFFISSTEITQNQYENIMGSNPSHFQNANNPVENVSWFDAAIFCNRLSESEGLESCYDEKNWACDFSKNGYRLPTEAEWEYAAFDRNLGKYSYNSIAWNEDNCTHPYPVSLKTPGDWGLYDVYGNVWEWCNDWYSYLYYNFSPSINPIGPDKSLLRVKRGGSFMSSRYAHPRTARDFAYPISALNTTGFRVARGTFIPGINNNFILKSPIGGEEWQSGTTKTINWMNHSPQSITLEYSSDNGLTWNTIETITNTTVAKSYEWILPDISSTECKIRIFDAANPDVVKISDNFLINETGVHVEQEIPTEFLTATAYPNPFNPQTTIQYKLTEPSKVAISVFNSVGQQVLRHDAGTQDAGTHSFIFNASELTTGTYFYRVETGPSTAAGKMLYMK
jgi:Tol biopolymer transport system component/formylglycine-generating enzyme required for sulfatase activity